LVRVNPVWHLISPGAEIWRIYRAGGNHPQAWNTFRSWGPHPESRFDHHPAAPETGTRGILYGASAITTCVAEAFQRTAVVAVQEYEPHLVCFTVTAELWVLDLRGTWPTRAGASMALHSALDRERTQQSSRAIYEAYPRAHGLWYASAMHANEPAIALYDRAEPYLARQPTFNMPLDDPSLQVALWSAAELLGYVIG
jgi:hypothetical protein